MGSKWTIPIGPTEGDLDHHESKMLMYLAGIRTEEEPEEVPVIGGRGPKSKDMTTSLVFHLHLTGHLKPRTEGMLRRVRGVFERAWRRWEIHCAPEPEPVRHHRPSLFPMRSDLEDDE